MFWNVVGVNFPYRKVTGASASRGERDDPPGPPRRRSDAAAASAEARARCLAGENRLHQLPESLLRGHGGGDEGDLHQQPHVEAVRELPRGHLQGTAPSSCGAVRACMGPGVPVQTCGKQSRPVTSLTPSSLVE